MPSWSKLRYLDTFEAFHWAYLRIPALEHSVIASMSSLVGVQLHPSSFFA